MYLKAREIAEKYGMKVDVVRNLCHAKGQKFAYQIVPNGRFYIDEEKFKDYMERKRA